MRCCGSSVLRSFAALEERGKGGGGGACVPSFLMLSVRRLCFVFVSLSSERAGTTADCGGHSAVAGGPDGLSAGGRGGAVVADRLREPLPPRDGRT